MLLLIPGRLALLDPGTRKLTVLGALLLLKSLQIHTLNLFMLCYSLNNTQYSKQHTKSTECNASLHLRTVFRIDLFSVHSGMHTLHLGKRKGDKELQLGGHWGT